MFHKRVQFFGQMVYLACDGKCHKAWGVNNRPKIQLSDDVDDIAYLSDDELGDAPIDPGTYEGIHMEGKPFTPDGMNRWCARECERSKRGPILDDIKLPDFSNRLYNQPWKHLNAND